MLDLFVFPDNKTWEFGQIHIAMEKPHLVIRKGMSLFLDVLIITILLASTGSVGVSGTCSASSCLNNGLCVDESGHTTCHCPLLFVGDICQYDVEPILTTVCMVNSSALSDEACELAVDTPGNIVSGLQTEWVADGNEDGAGAFIVLNLMAEYSVIGMKYRQRCDPQNQISRMAVSLNDGTIVVQDMPCSPTPNCADEQGATLLFDHAVPETHMVKIVVMELCSHGKLADIGFRDITVFTSIDECTLGPCQNSGTCIENDLGYTCNCDGTGFEGNNCEQNIDDCIDINCDNGGSCSDLTNGYECLCADGTERPLCTDPADLECRCMIDGATNVLNVFDRPNLEVYSNGQKTILSSYRRFQDHNCKFKFQVQTIGPAAPAIVTAVTFNIGKHPGSRIKTGRSYKMFNGNVKERGPKTKQNKGINLPRDWSSSNNKTRIRIERHGDVIQFRSSTCPYALDVDVSTTPPSATLYVSRKLNDELVGMCGDCNGKGNSYRLMDGTSVAGVGNINERYRLITKSYKDVCNRCK